MEKQISAIAWLVEQISYATSEGVIISHHKDITELVEQAREMEKKQLFLAANTSAKQAYKAGQKSMYCGCYEISGCTSYEDWLYEKTFKPE